LRRFVIIKNVSRQAEFFIIEEDKIRCELCPRRCLIPDGALGFCGARKNRGGTLFAENFGQITSAALDPIEKKPLKKFFPGSYILSVGSYGCNLNCAFCQNHEISRADSRTLSEYFSPRKLLETANIPENLGVAFTYNEPFISCEYILEAAPLLKDSGKKVVLVTNGTVNKAPLLKILPLIDAMNIDVKSFNPEFYKTLGGDLATVKRAVELSAPQTHIEITTLVIPGENDSDEEMERLTDWLSNISPEIPLHLSRFFPRYKVKDKLPTPRETLLRLKSIALRKLKTVYLGNI
jgi:pyruvate formate lyase activating enzyme